MAMIGWVGPVAAAQIHTGSELLFILNSARLLPRLLPGAGRRTEHGIRPPPPERDRTGVAASAIAESGPLS
jgi:hypothetical protein